MHPYDYRAAEVVKVVDGDTVDLVLDPGLHLRYANRFRLTIVDTPERGQPGYREATDFVREWFAAWAPGTEIRVATYRADSFGRWLADIYVPGEGSLSSALLEAGLAEVWD